MGLRRDLLLFPQGKKKALTFSYDDAVTQDVRFLALMNRYHLKGTFNINTGLLGQHSLHTQGGKTVTHDKLQPSEILDVYAGHELAVHGLTHLDMALAGSSAAAYEITADRRNIEDLVKAPVRGMAYPFGTYTEELLTVVKSCGMEYARTIKSTGDFALPENFLYWHPTCHHNDSRLSELAEKFLLPETGKYYGPKLFYVWGHTYEFDVLENWDMMEAFMQTISGKEEIWYATNIEICDYVNAARQLRYSASGQYIYNPTVQDIWLELSGRQVVLKSGETTAVEWG